MDKILLPLIYAIRDLRAGLKGFYIFLACLMIGVGAIAGVQSLSRGLVESLHQDGRYILGGDVALRTIYEPAPKDHVKFLHDVMGPITIVMETRAMARRMDAEQATLVELKAVDPLYPLYGKLEIVDENKKVITTPFQDLILPPAETAGKPEELENWGAVVEKELLTRLNVKIGDRINIGKQNFYIRGIISKEPDRIGSSTFSLAPRVMISRYTFEDTGLKKLGSQVYYDHKVLMPYVKTYDDLKAAEKKIADKFPQATWKGRDFYTAAPQIEHMINRLTQFFTLIGLTTLLIGGLGISNAVRAFLEGKLADIATLKCLGGSERFVFRFYMIQILALATVGIALGLLLGFAASQSAAAFLTERLSLTNHVSIYPQSLLLAAAFGYLTTFCFSLWPIGRAVKIKPADLFRHLISPVEQRPTLNIMLWILIITQTLALLAILTSSDKLMVAFFAAGALATFTLFYLYAFLIKAGMKKIRLPARPELRLAMANLYRPGNISTSVILSLGLGLTVLIAVSLVQYNFSRLVKEDISADSPSFFFLDIDPAQREAFTKEIQAEPTTRSLQMTPSFRGRIISVNGKRAEDALVDQNESWVINSDRGLTYAATLPAYSKVIQGKWWDKNYQGLPIVSIADNVAKAFNIGVGDTLTVNILGLDITAKVANVREINWGSFTMNFAITFAPGTLEKVPSTYLATVIVAPEYEERLQTAIAKKFDSVTVVRVKDALEAAQTFIRAIAQAISISAGITLLAGTLVLSGGIAAARRRHLYDAIILKVLGATQRRILTTFLLEYGLLGILTSLVAAAIGTAAAYAVLKFSMEIEWKLDWGALISITALCLTIALTAGFIGTWRALRHKSAQHLRNQ